MTFRTISIVMVSVCLLCIAAQASVYTYTGADDSGWNTYTGNWTDTLNWNPNAPAGAPGAADSVIFTPFNGQARTIVLDASEQVTNVTFGGNSIGCIDFYGDIPLTVSGAANTLTVTGAFNYNAFGITPFAPLLSGVAPTVTHGSLWLQNNADNFLGTLNVVGGALLVNNDSGLGDPSNTVTLGSAGQFGGLGVGDGPWTLDTYTGNPDGIMDTTPIARNITLAGNGGILVGKNNRFAEYTGTISGTGQLIVETGSGGGGAANWSWDFFTLLDGNNTDFSGGMIVANGGIGPGGTTTTRINGDNGQPYTVNGGNATNDVYGTGDIHIVGDGVLAVDSAANFGATASIYVNNTVPGGGLAVGMTRDYMPNIDPSSNGSILVGAFGGTNVDNVLGSTTVPVGDGTMWLGTLSAFGLHAAYPSCEYGGTSLAALILNDPTHTYKIGGGYDNILQLGDQGWSDGGTGRSPGVLQNLDGGSTVCNVEAGEPGVLSAVAYGTYVRFLDANTYTGTTTINPGVYVEVMDYSNGSGIDGAGAGGGDMTINGPGYASDPGGNQTYISMCIRGLNDNGAMITKGNLTFNGAVGIGLQEGGAGSWNNPSGTSMAQMTVSGLTRSGRSTLGLLGETTNVGDSNELFFDSNQAADAPLTNNMVPAYYWNSSSNEFLTYGANGFMRLTTGSANVYGSLASTPSTGIAYVGSDTVTGGAQTVYALRTTGVISGGTLTVGDGVNPAGVMFAGSNTQTANFAFGTSEGVIYTPAGCDTTISGTISGSNGLTKSGNANLYLAADNSATLSGDVTVDQGGLVLTNSNQVGGGRVVLNGGVLYLEVASTFTPEINLGPSGGTIDIVPWYGRNVNSNITGSGFLKIPYDNDYITLGGNNTYSGGTYMAGGCRVIVNNGSSLGTGPVYMATAGNSTDSAGPQDVLILYGTTNLANNRLVMLANDALVQVDSSGAAQIGSIEGVGLIQLGAGATNGITVGGNDLSTDYFGRIMIENINYSSSGLTKVGTGTLTLWGDNSYNGMTTVNNGTLANNNYINGPVTVTPGGISQTPVYSGTGTTAGLVTVLAGGTATGTGFFNAGLTLTGGTATGNITINGPVNIDGAGSFSSNGPITGSVTTAGAFAGNANITGNVNVTGGTFGGSHIINGTFDSSGAVSGASTFNGPVTVWTGTFSGTHAINANFTQNGGDFSGGSTFGAVGSPVTVTINGGTFQGNHTVYGSLTTTPGGNAIVAPSNDTVSAATLTIVGNVTLDASTTLNFNLGTPGTVGGGINDLIDITGNLSLDGTLNVTGLTGFSTGTYTLFTYTGALSGAGLTLGTMPNGMGYTYTISTATFGQVNLDVVLPWQPGDTNHDGVLNSLDIDAIYHNFGAPATSQWKVDGDGNVVGQGDVTYELHTYFHTNYGDANLDTKTDFSDFQVLLDHWQVSGPTIGWAQGDFNGSYSVDFLDFQTLLDYWNPGGWSFGQQAPAQTPEPATLTLLALGGLALLRRRK